MSQLFHKIKISHPVVIYSIIITLSLFSGFSNIEFLKIAAGIISDFFIRLFQLISLPIISLSILVTIATLPVEKYIQTLWKRTLLYTIGTTLIASTVSCLLYLIIRPRNVGGVTNHSSIALEDQGTYLQHISKLIPTNFFTPFIEHQIMSALMISIIVGIAIRYMNDNDAKSTVIHFFRGLHQLFLVITKWIIAILPIGLFGFITTTIVQLRGNINISGIGEYIALIVIANLIQGFIILPLWLRFNNIKPFHTMQRMMPALIIAFFSKSSAGTLPITMDTAEKRLNINPKISRFILPLCTTLNMNGCAAFIFATVIYLMQNQGIDITPSTMIIWIIISTIAALGNAGVPMGCFFLSASLLSSMNVPITLLGIILPFYSVIDMIETALNVWSDSCVTKVISKRFALDLEPAPLYKDTVLENS